jgi:uncharacterized protein
MIQRGVFRPQWEILMTPDERQMLSGLFDRIRTASDGPKDREAQAFIDDAVRNTPSSSYVLTQTVLVQQQALEAAAKRISELEAQGKPEPAPEPEGSFLGNIGRTLFGGGAQPASSAPPRSYDARQYERDPGPSPAYGQRPGYAPPPPPPQPGGPWGAPQAAAPQGGGFLQGALQTATGVAGGVLLGNALGGLFGGHGGGSGLFGGGGGMAAGGFGQPTGTVNETVNNYYETPGGAAGNAGQGLADSDDQAGVQDTAYDDDGNFDGAGGGGDDYA